jgi:antitoxin (DNA-binding transcriptional repressor) of toxin-antitoxin stability system
MRPYLREIGLTEARRRLSSLLREIEAEPDVGYQIKVRDRVVAELRSPASKRGSINSGQALLRAAREAERLMRGMPKKKDSVTSANYKEYLYGRRSPFLGRKHR